MKVILFAVLLATGCSKQSKEPAASDCSKVASAVDGMVGSGPMAGAAAEVPAKLKAILTSRCTEDKWPAAVIDCYSNQAKDMAGMKKCRETLPPEQRDRLINEIRTVMAGAAGGMAPPGHGGGGGGSAMDSAGSAMDSAGSAMGSAGSAMGSAGSAMGSAGSAMGSAGSASK